jgi:hypothetical protein
MELGVFEQQYDETYVSLRVIWQQFDLIKSGNDFFLKLCPYLNLLPRENNSCGVETWTKVQH